MLYEPTCLARTHTLSSFPQVFVEYKANFNFKQNTPNHHNFVSRAATLIISLLHAVFALVRGYLGVSGRLPAKCGCQTTCTSETTYLGVHMGCRVVGIQEQRVMSRIAAFDLLLVFSLFSNLNPLTMHCWQTWAPTAHCRCLHLSQK